MECGRHSLCSTDPLVASAHFVAHERRRVDRRRVPGAAVFGGNGSGTFLGEIRGGTQHGTSSKPSAEEFIGTRGLVGIYYGHLPRDGHPRQKVTLVLLADPESGAPKGYVLERIGVAKMPNARFITKGSWKLIKDPNRPAAVIYELDSEAPSELRDFCEVDKAPLLVLEQHLRVQRSGFGDPYTVAYALYGLHCNPGQRMRDCSHE